MQLVSMLLLMQLVLEENNVTIRELRETVRQKKAELVPETSGNMTLPKSPLNPPRAPVRALQPSASPNGAPFVPVEVGTAQSKGREEGEDKKSPAFVALHPKGPAHFKGGGDEGDWNALPVVAGEVERESARDGEKQRERDEIGKILQKAKEVEEEQDPPPILSRGNKHLQTTWGKPQPKRTVVSFRIGNEKVFFTENNSPVNMPSRFPLPSSSDTRVHPAYSLLHLSPLLPFRTANIHPFRW